MATSKEVDDFLAHFGVLGMRWGRRKPESVRRESLSTYPGNKNPSHPDHVYTHVLAKNPPRKLSTQELKTINDRLNTEQQYRRLNPTKLTKGKKIALGIIAAGTTATTAYNLINSPAGKAAILAGKKIFASKITPAVLETSIKIIA